MRHTFITCGLGIVRTLCKVTAVMAFSRVVFVSMTWKMAWYATNRVTHRHQVFGVWSWRMSEAWIRLSQIFVFNLDSCADCWHLWSIRILHERQICWMTHAFFSGIFSTLCEMHWRLQDYLNNNTQIHLNLVQADTWRMICLFGLRIMNVNIISWRQRRSKYENQNRIMRGPEMADVTFHENEFSTKYGIHK